MTPSERSELQTLIDNLSLINIERTPASLVRLIALQARDVLEKLIRESDRLSKP